MSIIKITGSGAYEHTQETNHSLEYLKRTLTEHKEKTPLDHPDGSVTEEKLSAEVRDRMSKHESDIQELNEKKADKSELDTKADKTIVYTKSETDTILSTKADKATTYTIAQTDTILSTKADKADVLSLQELATLNNEHVMTHDTDIRNLTEDKANKTDVYFLQQWCDNLNENKADRSELPTKVSQLENDKNYVTQEETESFVHSDTLTSDYYNANYIDNIVNEVSNTLSTNETAIEELKKEWVNVFEYEIEDDETYSIELTREAYPELFEAKRVFFGISIPKQTTNPDITNLYIVGKKSNVIGTFWTTKRNLTTGVNNGWLVLERFNDVYLTTVMPLQSHGPFIVNPMSSVLPRNADYINNETSIVIKNFSLEYTIPKGLKLTVKVEV